jgi:ankyrin repeat protein
MTKNEKLIAAVQAGNTVEVKKLLSAKKFLSISLPVKIDIDFQNMAGETALYCAVKAGAIEIMQCLLDAGAEPDIKTANGDAPLHCAIKNADTESAALLIQNRADPNCRDSTGATALHLVSRSGDAACAALLIAHGADVDSSDKYSQTPLYYAAHNGYTKIVELLLEAGADCDMPTRDGESPLFAAAIMERTEVVRTLVAAGADKNIPTKDGRTPLYIVWKNEYILMHEILIGKNTWPVIETAAQGDNTAGATAYIDDIVSFLPDSQSDERSYFGIPELTDIPDLFDEGKFSQIERILTEVRPKFADYHFVYSWLARVQEVQGEIQKAREILRTGIRLAREKYSLCTRLGLIEYEHAQLSAAVQWWIRSVLMQNKCGVIDDVQPFLYLSLVARLHLQKDAAETLARGAARGIYGAIELNHEGEITICQKVSAGASSDIAGAIQYVYEKSKETI